MIYLRIYFAYLIGFLLLFPHPFHYCMEKQTLVVNLTVELIVSYFRAMANGEIPPVKDRVEMMTATQKDDTGLTPGLLRILNRQV